MYLCPKNKYSIFYHRKKKYENHRGNFNASVIGNTITSGYLGKLGKTHESG